MKKTTSLVVVLIILLCVCLSACSADKSEQTDSQQVEEKTSSSLKADVDLTKLSSTMIYSEVSNMMNTPENYVGKIIKIRGTFTVYENERLDTRYYTVLVSDATACCQQGIEFIWNGEHTYPDSYPAQGTEIEIIGEYKSYLEEGNTFYHVVTDDVSTVTE